MHLSTQTKNKNKNKQQTDLNFMQKVNTLSHTKYTGNKHNKIKKNRTTPRIKYSV